MKTGITTVTLDYGKCPQWLYERIKTLGGLMAEMIIEEFGIEEFLRRLSHPVWFQTFGSLLAFDWNSSGLTVVLTAALKEAFQERNLGIYIAGGKGKTSRKTPDELLFLGEKLGIDGDKYAILSKLIAKIDNSLIQDGFNLYHHSFIITYKGNWVVIQQGMNTNLGLARRYHWGGKRDEVFDFTNVSTSIDAFSFRKKTDFESPACHYTDKGTSKTGKDTRQCTDLDKDLSEEPHSGIASDVILKKVLNLTSKESRKNKEGIIKFLNEENNLIKEINKILTSSEKSLFIPNTEFHWHPVVEERFDIKRIKKSLEKAKFLKPQTIIDLLSFEGIGPKTIRALSLASEVIYGARPSFEDPARYTFAHGGKDGTPYPVDRETYDQTIKIFNKALSMLKRKKIFING